MLCVGNHAGHFVKNLVKEIVIAYNKTNEKQEEYHAGYAIKNKSTVE